VNYPDSHSSRSGDEWENPEAPGHIVTTVPAGATPGKVQVNTPGGTLISNLAFHVLP